MKSRFTDNNMKPPFQPLLDNSEYNKMNRKFKDMARGKLTPKDANFKLLTALNEKYNADLKKFKRSESAAHLNNKKMLARIDSIFTKYQTNY